MADNTRYGKLFEKDHGDELVIRETSSASSLLEENEQRSRDSFLDRRKLYLLGATCAVFLLVNISWTIFLFAHNRPVLDCKPGPDLIYSPVREAVAYETILMNNSIYTTSKFKGEPNAAQDHAWWELSQWQNILLTKDDLKALNRTSIELSDGSGYIGMLDVFHEIHCLNMIRQYMYDYPTAGEPAAQHFLHVGHCLDSLRQIILCHGDISVVTFDWMPGEYDPYANFNVNRECRNLDKIVDWAKAHQADWSLLKRPAELP